MFYIAPGVYTQETDLSTIATALSTSIGALVGYSKKGSLDITLITNKQQFIQEYGEPTPGDYFHYSALAFLEQGNQLYCRRVVNGALYPGMSVVTSDAGDDNQAFVYGQSTAVFYNQSDVTGELFSILAKDPGTWGDSISCIIKNVKDGTETEETEKYTFEIDVYFTDTEGTTSKVENWKVSRKSKIDGYGRQMYLESKINDYSSYIVVYDNTAQADTVVPKENSTAVTFDGGSDGSVPTASQIIGTESAGSGWYGFYNPDEIDVRMLIDAGYTSAFTAGNIATIQSALITIAEQRKDCIAVLSVPYDEAASVADAVTYRMTTLNANSSWACIGSRFVKINDAYSDQIIEVPPAGYMAAMMAYTDYVKDTWWAPAGLNRGLLNTVVGLQEVDNKKAYTQGDMETLYDDGINPIQIFRGQGIAIWGQKTLQSKSSALDRINVRRLLIVVEKSLAISMREFVFEPNNELTRFRIKGVCDEFLGLLSAKGAFQTEGGDDGFLVVCDETNNTASVIDRNELHVDVFVKPVRSAEFLRLQTIITNSGASFNELISRGVLL